MQKYSRFVFCPDDYKEYDEHTREDSVNECKMWEDIQEFIRLAIKNGYQCRIWCDSYSICVDYNYLDESLSGVTLEWLGEDEFVDSYNGKEEE